jgi:nucleotide-binding universal stress UspA family protein
VTERVGPVLLAYDGSPSSATAIAVAGQLLVGREAVACSAGNEDDRTLEQVAVAGAELARAAGFEASALAEREQGKTWRALLEAGDRCGASLIVVGAHGLSGIRRAVLGSVSTAVIHHSVIPVLVVPGTAPEEPARGPALLCYDGSAGAKHAIAAAGRLLTPRRALVFHTWESWVAETPALAGTSATVQGMATELDEAADEQSEGRVAEGAELAERAGFEAEGLSERAIGPVWKAALDAADRNACDAIVVGSRGLTGISAALGSVSNGVVHHSRRPVLVVPPEDER